MLIPMRINHVLIDFENIQVQDLRELNRIDFRVTVFLGTNQKKIPVELVTQMQALGDRGEYIQISGNGPNALDFHIAFTIGEKCASQATGYFHIISNDSGFDPLIAYLKKRKVHAARYASISQIPVLSTDKPTTPAARADHFIEKYQSAQRTRPKTTKTLANVIRALFNQAITDQEIEQVVKMLTNRKFITVTNSKVTYPSPVVTVNSKP